jgi:hypothetical protein
MREAHLVVVRQEHVGVSTLHELNQLHLLIEGGLIAIAATVALRLKQLLEWCDLLVGVLLFFDFLEGELRVKELGINRVWSLEALADNENLSRLSTRGLWLWDLNFVEEILQHKEERVVVLRSENLGDEGTASPKHFGRNLESVQREFNLVVSVLGPLGADVGGTIIHHDIGLEVFQLTFDLID